jgi:hypothetical protein
VRALAREQLQSMPPDAFRPPGTTPEGRAEAVRRIGELVSDPRKGGLRIGQLIFVAASTKWPETKGNEAMGLRLFNVHDEDLAQALEEYLKSRDAGG